MGATESKVDSHDYGYHVARVKATPVPVGDIDKLFRCRCIGRSRFHPGLWSNSVLVVVKVTVGIACSRSCFPGNANEQAASR